MDLWNNIRCSILTRSCSNHHPLLVLCTQSSTANRISSSSHGLIILMAGSLYMIPRSLLAMCISRLHRNINLWMLFNLGWLYQGQSDFLLQEQKKSIADLDKASDLQTRLWKEKARMDWFSDREHDWFSDREHSFFFFFSIRLLNPETMLIPFLSWFMKMFLSIQDLQKVE